MRARRFFHILLTGLLFLLLAVSGASAWLLLSQGGLVQSLDLLEWASQGMVRIHGAQGRLLGPLTLEAVEIQLDGDHYRLHELSLDWVPPALLDKRLDSPYLRAERLELQFAENSTIILPDSLQLPFALHVAALEIGAISRLFEMGIQTELFPLLISIAIGAMIDFAPLFQTPITMIFGLIAQAGIFLTMGIAYATGFFTIQESASIGIIGAADGPTSIYVANRFAPDLLGSISVAAYSYMALVPLIQPPVWISGRAVFIFALPCQKNTKVLR